MKLEVYFRVIPEDENEKPSKWQYVGITQPVILKKYAFDNLYQGLSEHIQHFFSSDAFKSHIKHVTHFSMKISKGVVCMPDIPFEEFEKDIR